MAELTTQKISQTGLDPVFSTADLLGDTFANDGKTFLHVKNGGTSSITVTIDSVEQCNYGFDHNLFFTVPAGDEKIVGSFQVKRFNNESGKVSVTYSDTTSVTIAAIRM